MYIYVCIRALWVKIFGQIFIKIGTQVSFCNIFDKIVGQMSPVIFVIIAGGEGKRWRVALQILVYGTQRLKVKRIQVGT